MADEIQPVTVKAEAGVATEAARRSSGNKVGELILKSGCPN